MTNPRLSILTVTYNASDQLPQLINSLKNQTDGDFEWVVADGGSTDASLDLLYSAKKKLQSVVIDSRPDCGIYDALNRAVAIACCDYYLVAGADDLFDADAVKNFKKSIASSDADFITAKIRAGYSINRERKPSWLWLYGASARVSGHAIGTAINKQVHNEVGLYDKRYQIYADGHFMLKAIKAGSRVSKHVFISGTYSLEGISNRNQMISFSEQFRSQVENGSNWILQLAIFCLRLIKWGLKGPLQ